MGTWAIWKVLVKDSHLSLIEMRSGLFPKISFRVYPLDYAELFPVQLFIGWIPGWTTQIWVSVTPGLGPHTSPGWPPHLVPSLAAHLLSPVAACFFPWAFYGYWFSGWEEVSMARSALDQPGFYSRPTFLSPGSLCVFHGVLSALYLLLFVS